MPDLRSGKLPLMTAKHNAPQASPADDKKPDYERPDGQMHDDQPRRDDFSLIGFLLFAGLMGGAMIGGFGFYAPVPGALMGAALGLGIAFARYLWVRSRR
jgi:hypothetical protein